MESILIEKGETMPYTIVNQLIPESLYRLKSPYPMVPEYVTIHNTANDASAKNEISYMQRNTAPTSFHVAIDDQYAVQAIPFTRNGWHAGDGQGPGNRKSIGIEICYSKSGGKKYAEAEANAIEYIAHVLNQYGWGVERVKWHRDWSGKNCPHRIFDEGRATEVKNRISKRLLEIKGIEKGEDSVATPNEHIPSDTHKAAWEWAKEKGFLNGEFPRETLTRQQFATVLMRLYEDLNARFDSK
ncbi:N-acetylmuramoyl-L-alanine amidase family protein [Sporosarcina contaminans]|uniref:N-acetylmuramoyl-L-alanine amidase n=1 Tax=Sporosarcina contaminans TaxID=633403 RepID=A0ABW3TY51_9BACL